MRLESVIGAKTAYFEGFAFFGWEKSYGSQ